MQRRAADAATSLIYDQKPGDHILTAVCQVYLSFSLVMLQYVLNAFAVADFSVSVFDRRK
jgi:hypothetical protein